MEASLAREDYSNVLHTSASIFETLAKDVIENPTIQNQTLLSFFEKYKKASGLPEELLNYIQQIYERRNVTPLAGHGSTQMPHIAKEEAVTICEITKAFVEIEYRTRESGRDNSKTSQLSSPTTFCITISANGNLLGDEIGQLALASEMILAAENEGNISLSVIIQELDVLTEELNTYTKHDLSPKERIKKVKLTKEIQVFNKKQKLLSEYILMLFHPQIHNHVNNEFEVIQAIQGLAKLVLQGQEHDLNLIGLDIIYRKNPQIYAVIWINSEILRGIQKDKPFFPYGKGWDLFDLPCESMIRKAVPAIIQEVFWLFENDPSTSLDELLNLYNWSVGLH